jgi:hypothetical protein
MAEAIKKFGIKFESDRISPALEGNPYLTIDRQEIKRITFKRGLLSKHPLLQLLMGFCLSLIGIYVIILFFSWWFKQGGYPHPVQFFLFFTLPVGIWIIFGSIKKGYFLEVQYGSKVSKLEFDKNQTKEDLLKLIDDVNNRFNYNIYVM